MVSKYLFLLIAILLITPLNAVDLSNYDGYITPKFGASVFGDYKYTNDLIVWMPILPSFESNGGYYDIYNDNEKVNVSIWLNTTFSGELYLVLMYENKNGDYKISDYLVHSADSGGYLGWFTEEITIPLNAYGDCYFQFVLSSGYWFGDSSNKWSKEYTFFTKRGLNTNWKQKRLISVSSTEKMKDGITQLNLNESYMKDVNIKYTEDVNSGGYLYSYSGILTDLVFTNADYTKAYPYFINKYNGGYYEFNRNTTNTTTIDLWINEDSNTKNLYMFYDYTFGATPSYIYGSSVGNQHDRPNNPYTVHQVFNDLRLNESQFIDFYNTSNFDIYNRGNNITYDETEGIIYNTNFYNSIQELNLKYNNANMNPIYTVSVNPYLKISDNENNLTISFSRIDVVDFYYYRIYNETGNYKQYNNSGYIFNTAFISTNTTHKKIEIKNTGTSINIISSENILNINKFNIVGGTYALHTPKYIDSYLYYYQELSNNAITYSVSNASNTDYAYINFQDLLEYDTYINDLWIGGYIEIDNSGLFLCQDSENNILGSVNIVKDETLESFNIIFPYTITNQSKFLNADTFNYTCSFISLIGGFEIISDNLTINFTGNKIFLDTIKPIHQNNYSSEYVNYNINSELNYTGIQTDFYLETSKIKCLKVTNGQCIDYSLLNQHNIYNISNISINYNFNNIYQFDVNNWYMQYYRFYRNGEYSSSSTRFFYVYKDVSEDLNIDYIDFIEWNNSEITGDSAFMDSKFWENPLNYIGSLIYFMATKDSNLDLMQSNFLGWVLFLTLNFYTLLTICFIIFYIKYECHYISFIITSVLIALFTYMNWTPYLFHYVLILVIGIIAYNKTQ